MSNYDPVSLQRAADVAQPGDCVTVHAGVYRERINPPHGGVSDRLRMVCGDPDVGAV